MVFVVLLTLLLASVSALPQDELAITSGQERIVTSNIERAMEELIQTIQDAGLDPLKIDLYKVEKVTFIGSLAVWIKNMLFTGLSNIKYDFTYRVTTSRLLLDVAWPSIAYSVDSTGLEVNLFGKTFLAELGGSLEILEPRITGNLRFNIGVISGINIRYAEMEAHLKGIKSHLKVRIQNRDISKEVNQKLGETIPNYLDENQNEINAWLSDVTFAVLERAL